MPKFQRLSIFVPKAYLHPDGSVAVADTAFTISMALALKLAESGKAVDYALVWDLPHCEADYPGEVCDWIEEICEK